jgi:hypothetical protein
MQVNSPIMDERPQKPATGPPRRSRRLPLRFSLRLLLVAFSAFAIGFPIWYRWPYEVREPLGTWPNMFRTTTWQRQWGGGRRKHGPDRIAMGKQLVRLENYRDGVLDGPFEDHWSDGKLHVQGQFRHGKRDGLWIEEVQSTVVARTHWKNGELDGTSEQIGVGVIRESGQSARLEFSEGRLISFEGRPVEDRLASLLADGTIDDARLAEVWQRPGASLSGNRTVYTFVAMATAELDISLRTDFQYVDPNKKCLVADWRELTPAACIAATLASAGLTCDYRYGCLWITTPRGLAKWHEPTGVSGLKPPAGSALASLWNEYVTFEMAQGLAFSRVLKNLASEFDVEFDASRLNAKLRDSDTLVTSDGQARRFKDLLGLLLWQKDCRCELRGETLVILPQNETTTP